MVQIGTSNGYSTLWIADALPDTGGHLTSIDIAAANPRDAELHDIVELRVQDAADAQQESDEASWDMIFLDAERSHYVDYWEGVVRGLRPNGLLVVENVMSHADQVGDFRRRVSADKRVTEALVPIGAGALLVLLRRNEPATRCVHRLSS